MPGKVPALTFVRAGLTAGLSASAAYRQSLKAANDAGYSLIRRQTWFQLWNEVKAIRERVPGAMEQAKDEIPTGTQILPRETRRAGGYGQWAMTFTRPIGGGDLQAELYFQRSSEPLTPQQLEDMAEADIINSASTVGGTKYGYRFITAQYLGTERLIPIGR